MSTQTVNAKNGQAKNAAVKTEVKAERKEAVKRSDADLKKTIKGSLIVLAIGAFALAKRNEYEGVDYGKKKEKNEKGEIVEIPRNPYGVRFRIVKEGGAIDSIDEKKNEAQFLEIRMAAKDALADIKELKYTKKVKTFLQKLVDIKMPKVTKGFNAERLEGLTL